jgi:hypothetical protein
MHVWVSSEFFVRAPVNFLAPKIRRDIKEMLSQNSEVLSSFSDYVSGPKVSCIL